MRAGGVEGGVWSNVRAEAQKRQGARDVQLEGRARSGMSACVASLEAWYCASQRRKRKVVA